MTQGNVMVEGTAVELMKSLAVLSLPLRTLVVFLANLIYVIRCFLIMEIGCDKPLKPCCHLPGINNFLGSIKSVTDLQLNGSCQTAHPWKVLGERAF